MSNGLPDLAKGSYYANPLKDVVTDDPELKKKYPCTYTDNIWPKEDCPNLESAYKDVSREQLKIGALICKELDKYLHKISNGKHELDTFYNAMSSEENIFHKGRMLHYYPSK